jgi:general L-amino acid transport system permease protein
VLLQLFFWYAIFYESFPSPRQALNPFEGVFLCNRGLIFGVPEAHAVHATMGGAFVAALAIGWFLNRWGKRRQADTGQMFPAVRTTLALCVGLPLLAWVFAGSPTAMDIPELRGFNFTGGVTVSPEFSALLLGLVFYTAAFVAEIVRAGIQSVGHGQVEAAKAVGLRSGQVLHLVVLPHRHWLRGLRGCNQHYNQSDGTSDRGRGSDHAHLPVLQSVDFFIYELV